MISLFNASCCHSSCPPFFHTFLSKCLEHLPTCTSLVVPISCREVPAKEPFKIGFSKHLLQLSKTQLFPLQYFFMAVYPRVFYQQPA